MIIRSIILSISILQSAFVYGQIEYYTADTLVRSFTYGSTEAELLAREGTDLMLSMQYEEAANKFKEALELEENSYSYFGIGYSMIQLAQLEVAEESLQNAVRVDQNNEVAWYFLGEVYNKQEQLVLATESYQNSINVNPEYANPYLGLGVLLVNSGNQQDDENLKVEGCSYISEAANLGLSVAVQVLELSCSEQE